MGDEEEGHLGTKRRQHLGKWRIGTGGWGEGVDSCMRGGMRRERLGAKRESKERGAAVVLVFFLYIFGWLKYSWQIMF